jgi:hypothetical protein
MMRLWVSDAPRVRKPDALGDRVGVKPDVDVPRERALTTAYADRRRGVGPLA